MRTRALIICFFLLPALCRSQTEMICNGDFSDGDTCFFTEYQPATVYLSREGYFAITDNPHLLYTFFPACGDHTTGKGMMAVFNGDSLYSKVWEQKVTGLIPNSEYIFSFWITSLFKDNPAQILVFINGTLINKESASAPTQPCEWKNYAYSWTSDASGEATITLRNTITDFNGNDFALDDISMMISCRKIEGQVAGSDKTLCYGDQAKLGMDNPPAYQGLLWQWSPAEGLSATDVPNPVFTGKTSTRYYLTVFDSTYHCNTYDTVEVSVAPEIPKEITCSTNGTICPCDSATLSGPEGNFTYKWSTGETTRSINVYHTDTYSLTVTNQEKCSVVIDRFVSMLDSAFSVTVDSVTAAIGDEVAVNVRISSNFKTGDCPALNYSYRLKFNNSVLVLKDNIPYTTDGENTIIDINTRDLSDTLLTLRFTVILGSADTIAMNIEDFIFNCKDVITSAVNGQVVVTGLCTDPVPRLYKDTGVLYLKQTSGNPSSDDAEIEFTTIEKGYAEVLLCDALGNTTTVFRDNSPTPGKHNLVIDLSSVPSGMYYIVLRTPSLSVTDRICVVK